MVFQHYALYPHMTVRENMSFGLRNVGVASAEIVRRVAHAATMLEIEPLLDRKPGQISGGQRQRAAIGRAIVKEPRLFLFDEPLSNLDAALRVRTRLEIAQLHQRVNAAMVFVTHDQVEAMTLAHRIVVMNNRRIEQIGAPMEIYSRPATPFVAGFVGTPAMNFIPVSLAARGNSFVAAQLPDDSRIETRIPAAGLPADRTFRLGIRAESVRICAPEEGGARGRARFVERLGDRTLIYVELAGAPTLVAEDVGMSRVAVGGRGGPALRCSGRPPVRRGARLPCRAGKRGARKWRTCRQAARIGGTHCSRRPILFFYATLLVYPLFAGVWLSLHKADFFGERLFVGLQNFVRLFGDDVFLGAVRNTFYFILLTVPALAVIGLGLALALNRRTRTAAILRGVFFSSSVLSVTIVTLLWRVVFLPDGGLIANVLGAADRPAIPFLSHPDLALPAIAITTIWWCLGLPMMLFLAALQQVPRELYEAAALDSAGRWKTLWSVTLPSIRRTFVLVIIIEIVLQFQLFGQAQLMTLGGPNNASRPIVLFMYEVGFNRWDVGYASAASQVLFCLILIAAMAQYFVARRKEDA